MLGKPENLIDDTQNLGWGRGVGGIWEPWHPSVSTHEETVVGTLLGSPPPKGQHLRNDGVTMSSGVHKPTGAQLHRDQIPTLLSPPVYEIQS